MKQTTLHTRIIPYQGRQYASKIVFDNLEEVLNGLGYVVQRVESRESGKDTSLATRATTSQYTENEFNVRVAVRLTPHENFHYNTKIVLVGLEVALAEQQVTVEDCETREHGLATSIAIRAKLRRMPTSVRQLADREAAHR